jgi:hypothetical protein
MIINRIYETQKSSVAVVCFLPGRATDLSARQVHHVTGDINNTYCIEELRELGEVVPPATSDHLQQSQQSVPDIA